MKFALKSLDDTREIARDWYSKISDGNVNALGHQVKNIANKLKDELAIALNRVRSFLTSAPIVSINLAPSFSSVASWIGQEIETSTVKVSAQEKEAIEDYISLGIIMERHDGIIQTADGYAINEEKLETLRAEFNNAEQNNTVKITTYKHTGNELPDTSSPNVQAFHSSASGAAEPDITDPNFDLSDVGINLDFTPDAPA